jgi:PEP-CTERM motif
MRHLKATLGLAGILLAGTANAGLIGDSVTIELTNGATTYGQHTHTVGAGEEGNYFNNQFYDFGDLSFDIRSASIFCGITCGGQLITLALTDLDFGATLTNVLFTTNLSGVSVNFGSNFVSFSWLDQGLSPTTYLSADFVTSSVSVPEPASLGLFAMGMLGFGLSRLRARKH